jgi:hypothetical protein
MKKEERGINEPTVIEEFLKPIRSARADGGPRFRVCARETLRSAPHRCERKCGWGPHVCRVPFKHLPQPIRSYIQSFGTLGQLLKLPPCPPKSVKVQGLGGFPDFFLLLES